MLMICCTTILCAHTVIMSSLWFAQLKRCKAVKEFAAYSRRREGAVNKAIEGNPFHVFERCTDGLQAVPTSWVTQPAATPVATPAATFVGTTEVYPRCATGTGPTTSAPCCPKPNANCQCSKARTDSLQCPGDGYDVMGAESVRTEGGCWNTGDVQNHGPSTCNYPYILLTPVATNVYPLDGMPSAPTDKGMEAHSDPERGMALFTNLPQVVRAAQTNHLHPMHGDLIIYIHYMVRYMYVPYCTQSQTPPQPLPAHMLPTLMPLPMLPLPMLLLLLLLLCRKDLFESICRNLRLTHQTCGD